THNSADKKCARILIDAILCSHDSRCVLLQTTVDTKFHRMSFCDVFCILLRNRKLKLELINLSDGRNYIGRGDIRSEADVTKTNHAPVRSPDLGLCNCNFGCLNICPKIFNFQGAEIVFLLADPVDLEQLEVTFRGFFSDLKLNFQLAKLSF